MGLKDRMPMLLERRREHLRTLVANLRTLKRIEMGLRRPPFEVVAV